MERVCYDSVGKWLCEGLISLWHAVIISKYGYHVNGWDAKRVEDLGGTFLLE